MSAETLFNGFLAAATVVALLETGTLDTLAGDDAVPLAELACEPVDPELLRALLETAQRFGYVECDGSAGWTLSPAGRELAPNLGFLEWLVGGYGEFFSRLGPMAKREAEFDREVRRDPVRLAAGAAYADATLMEPTLMSALDELRFQKIIDIGAGTARRLIAICERYPHVRAVALDKSPEACCVAERAVQDAGLGSRIDVVCADVMDIVHGRRPLDVAREADLVMSFFMLHDLLSPVGAPQPFRALATAFPSATTFALADTTISLSSTAPVPIFSAGFELAHAFMRVQLFTREDYEMLFAEASLQIARRLAFGAPNSWLYVLHRA